MLAALVEEAVDMIRGAQWKDGYLNTYYSVRLNLIDSLEMEELTHVNRWSNLGSDGRT